MLEANVPGSVCVWIHSLQPILWWKVSDKNKISILINLFIFDKEVHLL